MEMITLQWLKKSYACPAGIRKFKKACQELGVSSLTIKQTFANAEGYIMWLFQRLPLRVILSNIDFRTSIGKMFTNELVEKLYNALQEGDRIDDIILIVKTLKERTSKPISMNRLAGIDSHITHCGTRNVSNTNRHSNRAIDLKYLIPILDRISWYVFDDTRRANAIDIINKSKLTKKEKTIILKWLKKQQVQHID